MVNSRAASYESVGLAREIAEREKAQFESTSFSKLECKAAEYIQSAAGNFFHPLNVIDFGGSGGKHGNQLPCINSLVWNVVETTQLSEAMSKISLHPHLGFHPSTEGVAKEFSKIHLVHVSSALHYTPEPLKFFDELMLLNPELIVLEKLVVSTWDEEVRFAQYSSLVDNLPGGRDRLSDLWKLGFVKYFLCAAPQKAYLNRLAADYEILDFWTDQRPSHLPLGQGLKQLGPVAARKRNDVNWVNS